MDLAGGLILFVRCHGKSVAWFAWSAWPVLFCSSRLACKAVHYRVIGKLMLLLLPLRPRPSLCLNCESAHSGSRAAHQAQTSRIAGPPLRRQAFPPPAASLCAFVVRLAPACMQVQAQRNYHSLRCCAAVAAPVPVACPITYIQELRTSFFFVLYPVILAHTSALGRGFAGAGFVELIIQIGLSFISFF